MKILIFGASGATGSNLVSQALRQEHIVTAFVRTPSRVKLRHDKLHIFQGDVSDYQQVADALTNQEIVLSALGASSPFKRDLKLIIGMQNIVAAMSRKRTSRLIYQSFLGVRDDRKELGLMVNVIMPVLLKSVIKDHEIKEDVIVKSNLDWTIVRCSVLTNGPLTVKYRTGEHISSSSVIPFISRADVADFMLKQMGDKTYLHKKPRIMY